LGGNNGGPETGECVLWLGDSGAGKSQVLVSVGICAARQGFRVAHLQLEGTREQCLNRYDAAWTGTLYQDVKLGNITEKKMQVTKKIVKKLCKNDIIVSSEETFNAKTIVDVRRELKDMEKSYGKIDVIIIDYLELLEVGDGHNYSPSEERFRQAKIAKAMKMLAMEFNAVVHTATQSSSISDEQKQDPEFVITRAQLSEDKGKIRPFDIFITINQTRDEAKQEVMRLHTDKLRDYKNGDPIYICNNFAYSRFYDRKRTLNTDWDEYVSRIEDKKNK
jgi:replicative DNA helicase